MIQLGTAHAVFLMVHFVPDSSEYPKMNNYHIYNHYEPGYLGKVMMMTVVSVGWLTDENALLLHCNKFSSS